MGFRLSQEPVRHDTRRKITLFRFECPTEHDICRPPTHHRHLAENLAWRRRFTLSLIKQHPGKESLVMKRRMCGWNDNFLMQVLTTATL
jgi:hypothetical protein